MPPKKTPQPAASRVIRYWIDAIGDPVLLTKFKPQIAELLSSGGRPKQFESLRGHPDFYSLRVRVDGESKGNAGRLIVKNHQGLLLVCGFIHNHNYHGCKFLRIKDSANLLFDSLSVDGSNNLFSALMKIDPEEEIQEENYYEINRKLINLHTGQKQVLTAELPVIISGGAGSGKTTTACALLTDKVIAAGKDYTDELEMYNEALEMQKKSEFGLANAMPAPPSSRQFLYIAKSKALVNVMKASWEENPSSAIPGVEVRFLTSHQWLLERCPELNDKKIFDCDNFKRWCKKSPLLKEGSHFFADLDNLYHDLSLCFSLDESQYMGLGRKQCHFVDAKDKRVILELKKSYQRHLDHNNAYDQGLLVIEKRDDHCEMAIVDEVQDLLPGQAVSFSRQYPNIVFMGDSRQSLLWGKSIIDFCTTFLDASLIQLKASLRCPNAIIPVANFLARLARISNRGSIDKVSGQKLESGLVKTGSVHYVSQVSDIEAALDNQIKKTHFLNKAVITRQDILDDKKAFAKLRALYPNVTSFFTPESIKGLEFSLIIWHELIPTTNNDIAKRLNGCLIEAGDNPYANRSKGANSPSDGFTFANGLHVASTRATETLIVVQSTSRDIKNIVDELKKEVSVGARLNGHAQPLPQMVSFDDFAFQLRELYFRGDIANAQRAYTAFLEENKERQDEIKKIKNFYQNLRKESEADEKEEDVVQQHEYRYPIANDETRRPRNKRPKKKKKGPITLDEKKELIEYLSQMEALNSCTGDVSELTKKLIESFKKTNKTQDFLNSSAYWCAINTASPSIEETIIELTKLEEGFKGDLQVINIIRQELQKKINMPAGLTIYKLSDDDPYSATFKQLMSPKSISEEREAMKDAMSIPPYLHLKYFQFIWQYICNTFSTYDERVDYFQQLAFNLSQTDFKKVKPYPDLLITEFELHVPNVGGEIIKLAQDLSKYLSKSISIHHLPKVAEDAIKNNPCAWLILLENSQTYLPKKYVLEIKTQLIHHALSSCLDKEKKAVRYLLNVLLGDNRSQNLAVLLQTNPNLLSKRVFNGLPFLSLLCISRAGLDAFEQAIYIEANLAKLKLLSSTSFDMILYVLMPWSQDESDINNKIQNLRVFLQLKHKEVGELDDAIRSSLVKRHGWEISKNVLALFSIYFSAYKKNPQKCHQQFLALPICPKILYEEDYSEKMFIGLHSQVLDINVKSSSDVNKLRDILICFIALACTNNAKEEFAKQELPNYINEIYKKIWDSKFHPQLEPVFDHIRSHIVLYPNMLETFEVELANLKSERPPRNRERFFPAARPQAKRQGVDRQADSSTKCNPSLK